VNHRTYKRKTYKSPVALTCAGCGREIPAGSSYWKDLTKQSWHPSCKRMGVSQHKYSPPRYRFDDHVGQNCEGCGTTIAEGEDVVHINTKPWHKECHVLMRR
jgi:hypothetical protein